MVSTIPHRVRWAGVAACLLCAFAIAAGSPVQAQSKMTLHLGNILAADHPSTTTAEDFAKAVAARTNGQLEIKVYPAGQLAGLREGTEGVRLGTIDMFWTESGTLGELVPSLAFVSLPFLFSDYDQAIRAMDKLRPDLDRVMRERVGVETLSWSPLGFQVVVTKNRAIKSAADMRGLKIRIPEIPLYVETFRALRTNAIPLAWGEIYTSLQTGVIEGVEGPTGAIETSKFYEVATDISRTNHILTDFALVMNKRKFDGLSKEYQAILREEAGRHTTTRMQSIARSFDDASYNKLKARMKSIDAPDITSFREGMKPVWDAFLGKNAEARAWVESVAGTK